MNGAVDSTIADLRRAVRADTDSELAKKLGIDKSTISGWRSRGRVPDRFVKMLHAPEKGSAYELPQVWGELQDRAQAIALLRFTLLRYELARGPDMDRALAAFLDLKPFWLVLNRAVNELRLKMEALGTDLATAQALMMQEDLRDQDTTVSRIHAQLAEDLTDNPWLDRWK